ncbi:adenylate kinase [Paenibacillus sediminis]|uniref:Dephospho-CoA kinase n=1 Tax=Paenibacillus sediminis TaxID=664909 RepID=A0ABS4H6K4_9BACL|nr:adenylate kinase [Paenibacillus sediminis]MBP1938168.1 dephospho-CoA kinase [Paenibacillus sediminis]
MTLLRSLPNIGLIGKLRAGKNVAADYLASKYGYTQFAFGDELKRYAHEIFGEPAPGTKPRELYQWFGQTMRERDPDVWARKCLDAIDWRAKDIEAANVSWRRLVPQGADVPFRAVISDVRQPNEATTLSSAGYVLIRVEAPDAVRIDRAIKSGDTFAYADLMHGTETALDAYPADFTVDNGGSLDELYAQIDAILEVLRID